MKYIIFDLDDTLLNDRREITPYTLDVLKKAQAMGHKLVCNTARSKSFAQKYLDQLQPDYAILNGGAMIIDRDENVVFAAELDAAATCRVVRELLKYTDTLSVQTREHFYSHQGQYALQEAIAFDFEKEDFPYPAQKIIASLESAEKAKRIAETYNLAYTTYLDGNFRRYNHPGATKALGNRNLMKLVGGTLEDVIAFGDDHGDMDMLREAGVGVLMKNASPQLHGQTSHISRFTNDEDGVARFLVDWLKLG